MTPEAFSATYREYLPSISRYLFRRVAQQDVEELAARVFEIAWKKREQAEPGFELPWLYKIAGFVVANHRRTEATKTRFIASLSAPDSSPSAEDLAIADLALANAWSKLSKPERAVISLVTFDGLDAKQAAKALEISPNAFTIRLSRARAKLKNLLEETD